MPNDADEKVRAQIEQALTNTSAVIDSKSLRLLNNIATSESQMQRPASAPVHKGDMNAADQNIKNVNEKFSVKPASYFAYTIDYPRELTEVEKSAYSSAIDGNAGKRSNFKFVKFFANSSETEAWGNIENYAKDDPRRIVLNYCYPEALVDIDRFGEIPPNQTVKIQYRDPDNNQLPLVVEIVGEDAGKLHSVSDQIGTTVDNNNLRRVFTTGFLPNDLKHETRTKRKLGEVNLFVIHDTAQGTFDESYKRITEGNLGVAYYVPDTGNVVKSADWDSLVGHIGGTGFNTHALGVEVVNPVDLNRAGTALPPEDSPLWDSITPYPALWALGGSRNKGVFIPTHRQQEAVWSIVQAVTNNSELRIPLKFLGLEEDKNRFVITGANVWQDFVKKHSAGWSYSGRLDDNGKDIHGGIIAHSYKGHADGAPTTLYCYLRSLGFDPNTSRSLLLFLLEPDNLIPERVSRFGKPPPNRPSIITQYYADLNKISDFLNFITDPRLSGAEL